MSELPMTLIIGCISAVFLQFILFFTYWMFRSSERRERLLFSMLSESRYRTESEIASANRRMTGTIEQWNDVNHLQKDAVNQYKSTVESPREMHLPEIFSDVGLNVADLQVDPRSVLVVMPFHPDFDDIYAAVRRACTDLGLHATRTDEEQAAGFVLKHVFHEIATARVIVAVLDGRNPNVFYEMGIAQAMDKPVIPVARLSAEQPFDVAHTRILFYSSTDELQRRLVAFLGTSLAGRT